MRMDAFKMTRVSRWAKPALSLSILMGRFLNYFMIYGAPNASSSIVFVTYVRASIPARLPADKIIFEKNWPGQKISPEF